MSELLVKIRAAATPKLNADGGSALVVSGVALLALAGALVYLPLGVALLGVALLAAGIGVMRA